MTPNPPLPASWHLRVTGVTAWYIRHGHNPANQRHQLSHKAIDYPLTELGVTQAAALAGQLAGEPGPAAIYASPLRRAAQTAEIIAARTGSDVEIVEGFRELDVGDLDGRCDEEAWAVYHQVLADWRAGRHDSAFPGGEDYRQMTARLAAAIGTALRHPPGSRVLIVGHGAIIRAAVPALCPGTPVPASDLPNCGIAELELHQAPAGAAGTLKHWPLTLLSPSARVSHASGSRSLALARLGCRARRALAGSTGRGCGRTCRRRADRVRRGRSAGSACRGSW